MKKIIVLFFFITLTFSSSYAEDTEITLFDEAQSIFVNVDIQEQKLIMSLDEDVYQVLVKIPDADSFHRKLSRIAFLLNLKTRTETDYWSNQYSWSRGFESTAEYKKLQNTNTEFRKIALKYEALKDEKMKYLKETKIYQTRNELRKQNCEAFLSMEDNAHELLMALQPRMNSVRKK